MKDIFTKLYVDNILSPFIGKKFRLKSETVDGNFSIPFELENSLDSTFTLELCLFGLSFTLKDNFYLSRDLIESMKDGIKSLNISGGKLDKLLNTSDSSFVELLSREILKTFKPQIAFIYYTNIKSLEVGSNYFVINGFKFNVINI